MDVGVDAYVTVEEVQTYLDGRGAGDAWQDAETSAKEAAIVEATSYLDAAFSWIGRLANSDQLLGWPRICAKDKEGRTLTGIPKQVKSAACELANLALGGRLAPMELSAGGYAVKRDEIGDVQVEYDTARPVASYGYVAMILRGLYVSKVGADRVVSLVRA